MNPEDDDLPVLKYLSTHDVRLRDVLKYLSTHDTRLRDVMPNQSSFSQITVADPEFPGGGAPTPKGVPTYYFSQLQV